jgi:NADH-quinone oxidoreductase subunit D
MLPEKQLVYTQIESLIHHFKLVMDGPGAGRRDLRPTRRPTASWASTSISDGSGRPTSCTCARPASSHMGGMHTLLEGYQVADIVPTFGSMNMIGGECDR